MTHQTFDTTSRDNAIAAREDYIQWLNGLFRWPDNDYRHSREYLAKHRDVAWLARPVQRHERLGQDNALYEGERIA